MKLIVVSVSLAELKVKVNCPSLFGSPAWSSFATTETIAVSVSAIVTLAVSADVSIARSVSPLKTDRIWTVTSSSSSSIASFSVSSRIVPDDVFAPIMIEPLRAV